MAAVQVQLRGCRMPRSATLLVATALPDFICASTGRARAPRVIERDHGCAAWEGMRDRT